MDLQWSALVNPEFLAPLVAGLLLWFFSPLLPSSSWLAAARRPLRVGGALLILYAVATGLVSLFNVSVLPPNTGALVWRLVLVLAGIYFLWEIINFLLNTAQRRLKQRSPDREYQNRVDTLLELGWWISRLLLIVIGVAMILSVLGIDITPLLTGLGLAGLALSLGAQKLVQDIIAGIFILLEDQFHIGDSIAVGDIAGSVEGFSLRATRVRDLSGTLHIIPNSEITIVSNRTASWARALVDVGVSYDADLDHVTKVLEQVAEQLVEEDSQRELFLERPIVTGPESFDDSAILFRMLARVPPGKQWDAQRLIRRRIKAAFDREGIEIPFPQVDVHMRK
ncbi:MAG: mechanosensitive ion channel family protein [Chloroflexi bacterium]|nr:MAG: mechanosensitive ion channel family protein [Chloroflexota bacterium]